MVALKVEVTLKDMIKPSSPTPRHLKTLKLSLLDQLAPPIHAANILYYPNPTPSNTTTLLKASLSETLVQFYPLAGRIDADSSFINCNDDGVEFYEARVSAELSAVIDEEDSNPDELIQLLPYAPAATTKLLTVASFQVNRFSCGGIAVGVCLSHKISDAATVAFLDAWATKARGHPRAGGTHYEAVGRHNRFIGASLFPPRDLSGVVDREDLVSKGKIVTKRLIFNKETIEALKKHAIQGRKMTSSIDDSTNTNTTKLHLIIVGREGSADKAPSKGTLVSAFIRKHLIEAARLEQNPPKYFGARQVVSLRTIPTSPVFQKNSFGNLYGSIIDCQR